jgi:hypothetical protein
VQIGSVGLSVSRISSRSAVRGSFCVVPVVLCHFFFEEKKGTGNELFLSAGSGEPDFVVQKHCKNTAASSVGGMAITVAAAIRGSRRFSCCCRLRFLAGTESQERNIRT